MNTANRKGTAMKYVLFLIAFALSVVSCSRGEKVPRSAYDPKLLDTADQIAKDNEAHQKALEEQSQADQEETLPRGECDREEGGCPSDHVCWDSYFCKDGSTDSCSASGDKLCHKRCKSDRDCTARMPRCVERPIFRGDENGVLEKFCIGKEPR